MMTLDDIGFSNREFWAGFITTSFPTALNEETDMSLDEMIEENKAADLKWWSNFTKYYDGVLEESDGYIDDPTTLICDLTSDCILKIEFHPGDTVYYVNDKQIACTGNEYHIHIFPLKDLLNYMDRKKDQRIFLLLLPITIVDGYDIETEEKVILDSLQEIFDKQLSGRLAKSIVYGLMAE